MPDIAVFLWPHIAFLDNGTVPDRFDRAPDWAIEILSPEQSSTKVIRNLLDCIVGGSQLGWLLNPDDATLLVFWPNRPPIFLDQQAPVPAPPEIPLDLIVADIFSWLAIA